MDYIRKIIVLSLFFIFSCGGFAFAEDCIEQRYVFELGSGTSRMTTYLFNKCHGNIIKEVEHLSRKMAYQCCISKSPDKKVDENCIKNGIATINEMKKLNKVDCKSSKCTGFATAWARKASNTSEVLKKIEDSTDVRVYAISQEEEAKMAYIVTQEMLLQKGEITIDDPNILLIDIGGGSYQITSVDPKTKQSLIYKGNTGTEILTREMKVRFPQKKTSMIECSSLNDIYKFYDNKVRKVLSEDKALMSLIKNNPEMKAYGFGSGIVSGLNVEFALASPVKLQDLEKINQEICGMSFDNVASLYPKSKIEYMDTMQSMFFLLHAIMKGIGVSEIHTAGSVNSGYYIVKKDEYWSNQ
ncbi:hypothetical protein [Candidatus Lariskella endosymbiont of Hedychridium roseum]|uniref:Ppx/GppA phosphatase family protein n=1 Tax=Candidatus Lariskella endosymbiont of Hedychridium roseum TaxID=3077949 RepID=UPI0030D1CE72